ncbi:hypothetical protein D3C74_385140 [compost metagenome]
MTEYEGPYIGFDLTSPLFPKSCQIVLAVKIAMNAAASFPVIGLNVRIDNRVITCFSGAHLIIKIFISVEKLFIQAANRLINFPFHAKHRKHNKLHRECLLRNILRGCIQKKMASNRVCEGDTTMLYTASLRIQQHASDHTDRNIRVERLLHHRLPMGL